MNHDEIRRLLRRGSQSFGLSKISVKLRHVRKSGVLALAVQRRKT